MRRPPDPPRRGGFRPRRRRGFLRYIQPLFTAKRDSPMVAIQRRNHTAERMLGPRMTNVAP
jgi:hypothetical protein